MLGCRRWAANILLRRTTTTVGSVEVLSLKDKFVERGLRHGNEFSRRRSVMSSCLVQAPGIHGQDTSTRTKEISTRKAAMPNNTIAPLQTIRAFLSGKRPFDAHAVHDAYHASKPHLLHYLTRSEFSNLITLFGSLSACTDASCLPRAPGFTLSETQRAVLAATPVEEFKREWWDFIIELGADQTILGRRTTDVDRYWLMRAHLSQGRLYQRDRRDDTHDQESGSIKMHASCDEHKFTLPTGSTHLIHAHGHYAALARNHLDESVHYAYLRGLFDMYPFLPAVRVSLADALSQLVSNIRFHFEPRLTRLFWDILHTCGDTFTHPERQTLLGALRSRLSFSLSHKHVSRTKRLIHPDSDSDEDPVLALRRAILDISTSDESWARSEACYVIVHDDWPLLVAIAGRPVNALALAHSLVPPRRINLLLGLRYLGKEEGLLERLWGDWMTVLGAEVGTAGEPGAAKVDRVILLGFLKAAAARKSDRVLAGVERLLPVHSSILLEQDGIYDTEKVGDPLESISVVLGAAWACIGTTNLTVLFARIKTAGFKVEDGRLPDMYLAKLVNLLLTFDQPSAAWSIAHQCKDKLSADILEALAMACAGAGLFPQAVSILSNTRLSSNAKFAISIKCLQQCSRRRVILNRRNALEMCEALGPQLDHVPRGLRHAAVWMALNAGLVRLAGLMGAQWDLSRRMQRKLVARLVRAKLCRLALRVVHDYSVGSIGRFISERARTRIGSSSSDNRFTCGEIDATRRGNILLSCAGRRRGKRLGGRAQARATLAALARLLRRCGSATHGHNGTVNSNVKRSTRRINARLSFTPDAITLNVLCRALARCTSGLPSSRLRALFDRLSCAGLCGPYGNHFGTSEADGREAFIVALAGMVRASDARASFVRHTRPLLKTFLRGFLARRDEEAARVVVGLLEAEDTAWRSGRAEDRI